MVARNDVTGDRLVSKAPTKEYEDNYDLIFRKKKDVLALLDGDIFMYRVGYSTEEEEEGIAAARIDTMLTDTLAEVSATEYKIFITCPSNFRKSIYTEYKANRTQPKPRHLQFLKDHLISKWGAIVAEGMEADDYLTIFSNESSIIVTIDKDLKQMPGNHYNFVKKEFSVVNELEGLLTFYTQFLVGDAADNIKGIAKVGPVGAGKYLNHLTSEQELFNKVREIYNDDDRMKMNGILLWMKRTLDDDWGVRFDKLRGDNE